MIEVVGIRFKKAGKMYYFDPDGQKLEKGGFAIVETARGIEYGAVIKENTFVPEETIVPPLKKVLRPATAEDAKVVEANAKKEEEAFRICLQKIARLELDMKLYQEETLSLLQDVYTPKMDCVPVNQEEVLENLLIRNYSKCRVGDRISVSGPQNRILQLCHSDGKIKLDEVKLVENGIQVQGIVELRILYIVSDDDMPFYAAEAAIPFTHVIEAEGIDKNCRYYLRTDLEQLSATMLDSNEIEVKAVINLNAIVLNQQKESVMQYVQENPLDREKIQNMPGIVCYMVQSGDTLWDIAKKFYTTADEIRELNNLKGDEIRPMQSLLLVKSIE